MKQLIDGAIANLEKIPVSGVNAILMGKALESLIIAMSQAPEPEKPEPEEPAPEPEEGEEECQL